ncbi:MAG: hypothetical protein NWE84_05390 [Candidatus Bathyarchaeota archaeon]|nr:hypothetical protein [Candidatus Bathyarchaeota archaeon]
MAFRIFRRWNKSEDEERHELEKEFYLTFSVVIVVLGIRLFLIPLYFWNMQSFVPLIPGAMCLWGVFNALPVVTWASLFLKIVLPAAYLSWLLLARINSSCRTNPLIRNLMALFLVLTPALLIDFGTEIYVLSQLSPVEVSCCTSAIDVGTRIVPMMIGGLSGQILLLLILFPYGILYVASLMLSNKHKAARLNALAITIPIGIVFIITIAETLTPWLLRLPFHHCPFCLFFQHPLSLVFTVLFWFGLVTPWLTLTTGRLGRSNNEAIQVENRLRNTLTTYGAFAMIIGMTLILADILIVFS